MLMANFLTALFGGTKHDRDMKHLAPIIKKINEDGVTVLLVEQNAKKALSIADRAYVLETGKIVLEGNAKDLLEDDSIKKAYLGE